MIGSMSRGSVIPRDWRGVFSVAVLVSMIALDGVAAELEPGRPGTTPDPAAEAAAAGEEGAAVAVENAVAEEPGPASEDDPAGEFSPEVEKILTETSDKEAYTDLQRCIPVRAIRDSHILDDRHIVFELTSKRLYLVEFQHRCHRLQKDSALIYEPRGGQLCRLDQIRAANNFNMRDVGPPCSIPGFAAVTADQVALLKEALNAKRKEELETFEKEKAEKRAAKKAESSS